MLVYFFVVLSRGQICLEDFRDFIANTAEVFLQRVNFHFVAFVGKLLEESIMVQTKLLFFGDFVEEELLSEAIDVRDFL